MSFHSSGYIETGDGQKIEFELALDYERSFRMEEMISILIDNLMLLSEAGVGAIYLGNINTPFSFNDSSQQTQAVMNSSGIFLRDDYNPGAVHQLDFRV